MAQLPPAAVFGAARPGQPVHVLLLIENSLAMLDHWSDLQQHILPGVLGAVRIANQGTNVQVFCMTTGKTQEPRTPEPSVQKSQRQFNDFPDIDIVNLPRNRMSATFIRQSIDMFLGGPTSAPQMPVTRHLFVVAMSNPVDDIGSPTSPAKSIGGDPPETADAIWSSIVQKLLENDICLHVIANPIVRLSRIFDIFRKTMRAQARQEVIPWQPVDNTHCICHLSGSNHYRKEKRDFPAEDWPEMNLPVSLPPSPRAGSPPESDEEPPFMSPMELINDNLRLALAASQSASSNPHTSPGASTSPSGVGAGMSLVSRMQALHGLANRRRPGERTRSRRTAFFRDTPAHAPPSPSPRRERLRSLGSTSSTGPSSAGPSSLSVHTGAEYLSASTNNTVTNTTSAAWMSRPTRGRHHSLSSASALDLQGLAVQAGEGVVHPSGAANTNTSMPFLDASSGGGTGLLPPSSPASDTSGSTLSNSFMSLSQPLPGAYANTHTHPINLNTHTNISQTHYSSGPQHQHHFQPPSASPTLTQTQVQGFPPSSPTHTQTHGTGEGGFPLNLPSPTSIYSAPLFAANAYLNSNPQAQVQGPSFHGGERNYMSSYVGHDYYGPHLPAPTDIRPPNTNPAPSIYASEHGTQIREPREEDEAEEEEEVVPASAPPDARGQVPFVFDTSYEAQSVLRLRQAVDDMRHHPHQQQQNSPPHAASAAHSGPQRSPPYGPAASAPALETARSGSSSASEGLGRGLGLAMDESWKGGVGSGQIPEFPETFYEPSRARLAERGAGMRRSTYG